jgi:hypothetical protein
LGALQKTNFLLKQKEMRYFEEARQELVNKNKNNCRQYARIHQQIKAQRTSIIRLIANYETLQSQMLMMQLSITGIRALKESVGQMKDQMEALGALKEIEMLGKEFNKVMAKKDRIQEAIDGAYEDVTDDSSGISSFRLSNRELERMYGSDVVYYSDEELNPDEQEQEEQTPLPPPDAPPVPVPTFDMDVPVLRQPQPQQQTPVALTSSSSSSVHNNNTSQRREQPATKRVLQPGT